MRHYLVLEGSAMAWVTAAPSRWHSETPVVVAVVAVAVVVEKR